MKLRVLDRLWCALTGLVLLAGAAALVAETFFAVPLTAKAGQIMASAGTLRRIILIAAAAVLVLLGLYGLSVLFRRNRVKRGFVLQKTENGELSISIKAIEGLVQKCVDKHDELRVTGTSLESGRDGLIVKLRVSLASGLNIPLAVSALQKQIKQYITACSGIDVKEVRVQVEGSVDGGKPSPYDVPEMLQNPPPLPREEEKTVEVPAIPAEEKEEKCLHQRLFGSEEQPATVPEPPAPAEPAAEEAADEADEAPAEEPAAEADETATEAAAEQEEVNHEVAE